jgi:hypothetical protein
MLMRGTARIEHFKGAAKASEDVGMREGELLVIEALAVEYSGKWREGEDPPDAYLTVGVVEIGVEISSLTQQVSGGGPLRPRRSDDMATFRLVKELNAELGDLIPLGSTIGLVLSSPILELRKTKTALAKVLRERAASIDALFGDEKIVINGNAITLFCNRHGDPSYNKISAAFMNRDSCADVFTTAHVALEERIRQKADKCRNILRGSLWLALLNDDGLTEPYVYQLALDHISVPHPFSRILVVSRTREVASIFERGSGLAPP